MENLGTIATILSALSPFLGMIVYFFKKILDKIDNSYQQITKVNIEMTQIKDKLSDMERDIEKSRLLVEITDRHSVEIEVIRRDLTTCFSKLDKLQERF